MKTINRETGTEWSQDELSKAFDEAVRMTEALLGEEHGSRHWKDSISTVVDVDEAEKTAYAIAFYTGAPVKSVELLDGSQKKIQIKSIGYRAGPAGDH